MRSLENDDVDSLESIHGLNSKVCFQRGWGLYLKLDFSGDTSKELLFFYSKHMRKARKDWRFDSVRKLGKNSRLNNYLQNVLKGRMETPALPSVRKSGADSSRKRSGT